MTILYPVTPRRAEHSPVAYSEEATMRYLASIGFDRSMNGLVVDMDTVRR
jgi:hypothetical protein